MIIKSLLLSTVLCAYAQAAGSFAELALYAKPLGRALVRSFAGTSPLMAAVTTERFFSTKAGKSHATMRVEKQAAKKDTSTEPLPSTTEPVLSDLEIKKRMDDFSRALEKARVNCFPTVAKEFPKLGDLLTRTGCTFGSFERYKREGNIDLFVASTSYRDFRDDQQDWFYGRQNIIGRKWKDLEQKVKQDIEAIDKMFLDVVYILRHSVSGW